MAYPVYTRQQLLNRGMVKIKKVASDLGVLPSGDKRLIQNWVEAIVQHQAAQVQKIEVVEEAVIIPNLDNSDSEKYEVTVNGEVVHRCGSQCLAERYCKWHSLAIVDSQTLAQQELEAELEVQATTRTEKAKSVEVLEQHKDEGFVKFVVVNHENDNYYTVTPAHPIPKERCECGDNHLRGAECKHQIAVKKEIASQISFISPSDFGYYEAIVKGDLHYAIATIDQDFDSGEWVVKMEKGGFSFDSYFDSYMESEQFIKDEYVKGVMEERGSGRIEKPIENMGMTIQDIHYQDDRGSQYSVRVHGVLAGYIWLNEEYGWTLDGIDWDQDWHPVGKKLIKLTRHEYLIAA